MAKTEAPTIDDVKRFWEQNPLFAGESSKEVGSREYFEEHERLIIRDCFAGAMDDRIFELAIPTESVLDLGCGPGFWPVAFAKRGFTDITACDLTSRACELTRLRCQTFGVKVRVVQGNAENLPFSDGQFQHVNCQGVVHHTTSPRAAVHEIARVLRPGGTASISVYYKNALLRAWPLIRGAGRVLHRFGGGLKGRGRETIFLEENINEIVRLYDGKDNPIGLAYTRDEFGDLVKKDFEIKETFLHFFPAWSLPVGLPLASHRWLDRHFGFLIYSNLIKR